MAPTKTLTREEIRAAVDPIIAAGLERAKAIMYDALRGLRDRHVKLLLAMAAEAHAAAVELDAIGNTPAALRQTAVTQALRRAAETIRQGE